MRKLILQSYLSPGDIITLTAAVRDLHLSCPGRYLTDVRTSFPQLWEGNPYITALNEEDSDVELIEMECPLIATSNQLPYHYIHAFRDFLAERLGENLRPHAFKGDVYILEEEKRWLSQVDEITGMADTPYWIIVPGGKMDYTAKWWDPARFQQVVDHFRGRLLFVQCGAGGEFYNHPRMNGVIDLVGKTDMRQLVRLMYHARGVVCAVTMYMHLAAAVEMKPRGHAIRPCVVVAGGREPVQWEMYPTHQFVHRIGSLPCCEKGGCWRARVVPLNDGKEEFDGSLCHFPVKARSGAIIPRCMDSISAEEVIGAVEQYLLWDSYVRRPIDAYVPGLP